MSDVLGTIAQGVNPLVQANQAMQIRSTQQSIANAQQQLQANQFALQQAKLQPVYASMMALNPDTATTDDVQQALGRAARLGGDIDGPLANLNQTVAQGGKVGDFVREMRMRGMTPAQQFGIGNLTAEQLAQPINWVDAKGNPQQTTLGEAIRSGYGSGTLGGGGGAISGVGAPGGGGGAAAPSGLPKEQFLSYVQQRESGGQNVRTRILNPQTGQPASTASGLYQILDSTWADGKRLAGIDPNQYPTAMSAPPEVQHQVAGALYDKYGETPWAQSAPGARQAPYQVAGTGPVAPPSGGAAAPPPVGGASPFQGGVLTSGQSPYMVKQFQQGASDYADAMTANSQLSQRISPLLNTLSILHENPTLQTGPGQDNLNNWIQWGRSMGLDVSGMQGANGDNVTAWQEIKKFLLQYDQGIPGAQRSDLAALNAQASNPNTEQGRNAIAILAGKAIGNEMLKVARYRQFQAQNPGAGPNGWSNAATRAQFYNLDTADWGGKQDPMAYAAAAGAVPPEAVGQYMRGLPSPQLKQNFVASLRSAQQLFPEMAAPPPTAGGQ